jgi:phage terminase large subunit-like protein
MMAWKGDVRDLGPWVGDIPLGYYDWDRKQQDLYRLRTPWLMQARANQLPPPGDWWIWLLLAGRGFGKTRTAAEDICYHAIKYNGWRLGVVAPTFADLRDTCFEGESGICAVLEKARIKHQFNRSQAQLTFASFDSTIRGIPGDQPDRLRGPQFHRTWVDELAAMDRQDECWLNVEMCTRLKPDPRIIVTTTPKPTKLIRLLKKRAMDPVAPKPTPLEEVADEIETINDELRRKGELPPRGHQRPFNILTDAFVSMN